jgi:NAD-specific glutamate dehydrogenase
MPFLLDSVMGELTEQGLDVRLVLHPIFTVERDHTGALIGFRGDGPAVGAAQRESFITSMSSASRTRRGRTESSRRSARCWRMCASACRTGGRCSRASAS